VFEHGREGHKDEQPIHCEAEEVCGV
jgi:hypothetical protein